MATEKVSLTLDSALLKEARGRAGRRGLSAYVDSALRRQLQRERIRKLLADLDTEFGPAQRDVIEKVRREWPIEKLRPRRKSRRG